MALIKLAVALVAILVALFFSGMLFPEPEVPQVEDSWWGRGARAPQKDTSIRPFKVQVPEPVLSDLKSRLQNARFNDDLSDSKFEYGFPAAQMRKVAAYWTQLYDWRRHEQLLNSFDQFTTTIQGIDVHFLRVKPKSGRKGRPLLIVHGWPGSVWEFHKLIPRLTDPAAYGRNDDEAFEVIAPSIPGYAFSEQPHRKGFGTVACANVFMRLMERLGHDRYYVQGGDWGAGITENIAKLYSDKVIGLHTNFIVPAASDPRTHVLSLATSLLPTYLLGTHDLAQHQPMWAVYKHLLQETGYLHIQATKPDTAGMGLNDSPIGLAGWILEKFSTWTDKENVHINDGGLTKKYSLDELLTNVMIYWVTGSIASSQRFYKESFGEEGKSVLDRIAVRVPAGLASFPNELVVTSEFLARLKYKDIVQYSHMEEGGHFAAFEQPQLLAEDLLNFVTKLESRTSEAAQEDAKKNTATPYKAKVDKPLSKKEILSSQKLTDAAPKKDIPQNKNKKSASAKIPKEKEPETPKVEKKEININNKIPKKNIPQNKNKKSASANIPKEKEPIKQKDAKTAKVKKNKQTPIKETSNKNIKT